MPRQKFGLPINPFPEMGPERRRDPGMGLPEKGGGKRREKRFPQEGMMKNEYRRIVRVLFQNTLSEKDIDSGKHAPFVPAFDPDMHQQVARDALSDAGGNLCDFPEISQKVDTGGHQTLQSSRNGRPEGNVSVLRWLWGSCEFPKIKGNPVPQIQNSAHPVRRQSRDGLFDEGSTVMAVERREFQKIAGFGRGKERGAFPRPAGQKEQCRGHRLSVENPPEKGKGGIVRPVHILDHEEKGRPLDRFKEDVQQEELCLLPSLFRRQIRKILPVSEGAVRKQKKAVLRTLSGGEESRIGGRASPGLGVSEEFPERKPGGLAKLGETGEDSDVFRGFAVHAHGTDEEIDQSGFSNPRFADDPEKSGNSLRRVLPGFLQGGQLPVSSDQKGFGGNCTVFRFQNMERHKPSLRQDSAAPTDAPEMLAKACHGCLACDRLPRRSLTDERDRFVRPFPRCVRNFPEQVAGCRSGVDDRADFQCSVFRKTGKGGEDFQGARGGHPGVLFPGRWITEVGQETRFPELRHLSAPIPEETFRRSSPGFDAFQDLFGGLPVLPLDQYAQDGQWTPFPGNPSGNLRGERLDLT